MSQVYCLICNDNIHKTISCNECFYISCINCIKKINELKCCNCNKIYDDITIKPFIKYPNIFKIYKKTFIENIIKDYTNFIIRKCILAKENRNLLRFGYQKIESDFEYIFKCNYRDCTGMVNLNHYCNECKNLYCTECEEIIIDNHVCDENILKSINNLKQNCKKCINCYTYLEKIEGCNDMRCLNCGVYFNWRNLKIDYKGNTNPTTDRDIINISENNLNNLNIFNNTHLRYVKNSAYKLYQEICKSYIKLTKVSEIIVGEYFIAKNKNEITEKNIEKLYLLYKKDQYYNLIINYYIKLLENVTSDVYILVSIDDVANLLNKLENDYIFPNEILYTFNNNDFIKKTHINGFKTVNDKLQHLLNEVNKCPIEDKELSIPIDIKRDNKILKKLLTFRIFIKFTTDYKIKIYEFLYIIKTLNIEDVILIVPNNNVEKYWKLHLNKYNLHNKIKIIYITNKNMCNAYDQETLMKKIINYVQDKQYLLLIDELHLYQHECYRVFSKIIFMTIENRFDTNRYLLAFSSILPIESMFYNVILFEETKKLQKFKINNIILEMVQYLNKSEIINLTKKVYYGKKYKNIRMLPDPYLTNDLIFNKDDNYTPGLYNQNNWSQVDIFNYIKPKYVNNKVKVEKFSHRLCRKEKISCKFCNICNPEYINKDLNSCCYIHIKPNNTLKTSHNLCFDERVPITENVSLLINKIVQKNMCVSNLTKILLNYGFSIYEINLLLYTTEMKPKDFIKEYNSYILNKTLCDSESNKTIEIFTKKYALSDNEIACLSSAFTRFDYINNTVMNHCDVVATKGYMQIETIYINYIYKDITEIYNKYKNVKIIVGLYFNSSMSDLERLLNKENYNYLILNNKVSNKNKVIERFNNGNYILISSVKSFNNITEPIDDRTGNETRYILLPFIYDIINTCLFLKKTYTESSETYPVIHVIQNYENKHLYNLEKYNFNLTEWINDNLWNSFV